MEELKSISDLKIIDVLGQVVNVLVDEIQESGYKSIEWNIPQSDIASGIYFYRIDAVSVTDTKNKFTQVKKMLLMK